MENITKNTDIKNIREAILKQTTPFCLTDIFNRLEKDNVTTDKAMILEVLDELYDDGLVEHKNLDPDKGVDSTKYGFVVL